VAYDRSRVISKQHRLIRKIELVMVFFVGVPAFLSGTLYGAELQLTGNTYSNVMIRIILPVGFVIEI